MQSGGSLHQGDFRLTVKPIPERFHSVTPYLFVEDGAKLIGFLQQAFGAEQLERAEARK